jgi:hypothetical protein
MDRVLVYYFNQSCETLLPNQEEDVTLLEWRMTPRPCNKQGCHLMVTILTSLSLTLC